MGQALCGCLGSIAGSKSVRLAVLVVLALCGAVFALCVFVKASRFTAGLGAAPPPPAPSSPPLLPSLFADFSSGRRDRSGSGSGGAASGEERCRAILERLFGRPFPKVRPEWLTNPATGHRLELDCYCEELGLAVEYDGIQHSVFVPHFHGTEDKFDAQVQRDRHKERLCQEHRVSLVRVPYTHHGEDRLEPFLRAELQRRGFLRPSVPTEERGGKAAAADR